MSNLGESISAIIICMAVATMCLTVCYVFKNTGSSFMITVLMMVIISSLVRVVERFNYTETLFDKEGDYFGELALLKNAPRAANVIAKTQLKVAMIERESFMRLLGPLEEILKRNMEHYANYAPQ